MSLKVAFQTLIGVGTKGEFTTIATIVHRTKAKKTLTVLKAMSCFRILWSALEGIFAATATLLSTTSREGFFAIRHSLRSIQYFSNDVQGSERSIIPLPRGRPEARE
jgi:hypothetical protein